MLQYSPRDYLARGDFTYMRYFLVIDVFMLQKEIRLKVEIVKYVIRILGPQYIRISYLANRTLLYRISFLLGLLDFSYIYIYPL